MFLVYFLPKIFSFFLVPIYTSYLSTEEYGVSDLIISTSSLIAPFVALGTPSAILRYTIENKKDIRPYQISVRIFTTGMIILLFSLTVFYLCTKTEVKYLLFVFLIVGVSLLSDINISYTRGLEKMKIITVCGVGSSFVSICSNILFIVILGWGLYGFLIATVIGYLFSTIVILYSNKEYHLFKDILKFKDKLLQRKMLAFSVPLVFSGLSWWIVTLSDRYFISFLCGTAENGLYSVANKIPIILQAVDNVFGAAWMFTVYDSYKTDEGKEYIAKVFNIYSFILCIGASVLIAINLYLSSLLFSKDFFLAWRYVSPLLLSVVFSSSSSLIGVFLAIYKKTNITMWISFIAAFMNVVLNWSLVNILNNAMGAAIATAITFFISYCLTSYFGIKLSGVKVYWKKQVAMYLILCIQTIVMIKCKDFFFSCMCVCVIIFINWDTILWGKSKWRLLLKK